MFSSSGSINVVKQGCYVDLAVGENQPYAVYVAMPLITCFAYLFYFENAQHEQRVVLYHAAVGDLNKIILQNIIDDISKRGDYKLQAVKVALSDNVNGVGVSSLLQQAKHRLDEYEFDTEKCFSVVIESVPSYCVDTRGRHHFSAELLVSQEITPHLSRFLNDIHALVSDSKWNNFEKGFLSLWASAPQVVTDLRKVLSGKRQYLQDELKAFLLVEKIIGDVAAKKDDITKRDPQLNELYDTLTDKLTAFQNYTDSNRLQPDKLYRR